MVPCRLALIVLIPILILILFLISTPFPIDSEVELRVESKIKIKSKSKMMSRTESGLREECRLSLSTLHHFNPFNLPQQKGAAVETAAPG